MTIPDPAEALEQLLEGPEPPWDDEPEPAPNPDRADAMLRRQGRLEAEQAEICRHRDRIVGQANEWADRELETRARQITWLKASLAGYLQGIYERTGTMSLHLPSGDLVSRKNREEWIVHDEAELLTWAETSAPALLRQPPVELDRNRMKAELTQRDAAGKPIAYGITADGDVAPGLEVRAGDRYYDSKPHRQGDHE